MHKIALITAKIIVKITNYSGSERIMREKKMGKRAERERDRDRASTARSTTGTSAARDVTVNQSRTSGRILWVRCDAYVAAGKRYDVVVGERRDGSKYFRVIGTRREGVSVSAKTATRLCALCRRSVGFRISDVQRANVQIYGAILFAWYLFSENGVIVSHFRVSL